MGTYSLTHVGDRALLQGMNALAANDHTTTAALLAHLAEIGARRLFVSAGFTSLFAYCVGGRRMSEDMACKRIKVARKARQFPAIFDALADGRLHLSGVLMLAPHLTKSNATELLAAAANRSKAEIERLLAERFPRTELITWVETPVSSSSGCNQPAPGRVVEDVERRPVESAPGRIGEDAASTPLEPHIPSRVERPTPRARVTPLAPQRFGLQASIRQETHDLLREAQELSSHDLPTGDIDELLNRALGVYVRLLRKRRFAATDRPRPGKRGATGKRTIPAAVQRTVWERDGGQCTYVCDAGHRCTARTQIEYDHIEPVARGGRATVENLRLRCRTHNHYEAERTFGAGFMSEKRGAARRATAERGGAAAEAHQGAPGS